MIVGSIKENLSLEKRVSITPETAKNIISLGLKVIIENDYAAHIGIADKEYEAVGVEIKNSSKEVLNRCDLLTKVYCPQESEISKTVTLQCTSSFQAVIFFCTDFWTSRIVYKTGPQKDPKMGSVSETPDLAQVS